MDDFATGYLAGQDGGNNNGGFFGNEGLWAVIILAIIFGWGNYGNGRNGSDNGMASYIPYLVGTGATGQGGNVCDRHRHVQISWLLLPFPRWCACIYFLRRYRLWARTIFAA